MNCLENTLSIQVQMICIRRFDWSKKNLEENRAEANTIENSLVNLMKLLESAPKSDVKQIEVFYKIRIAELIFYFNSKNQNQ